MEGRGEGGRVPEGDMGPCLAVAEDHGSHEDVVAEGLSNLRQWNNTTSYY